jgi:hypothetical protein
VPRAMTPAVIQVQFMATPQVNALTLRLRGR